MAKQDTQQNRNASAPGKQSSAAASKPAPKRDQASGASGVEGEGSYTGTRQYNENLAKHLETHDVEKEAEEARAALEGDEREELTEAEGRAKQGSLRNRQNTKRS